MHLHVVGATGSFESKTLNEDSLAVVLGAENHPYPVPKWAF